MKQIPKFEGEFLECGGGFYLVKKDVLELYFERMEKLEKEVEKMNEKKRPSERTVVGSNSGRRYALSDSEKAVAKELHEKGYSLREIGHVLKVSHETVRQAIKEGGLTAEQKRLIAQQKKEGWHVFQCFDSLQDMGHDVDFIDVDDVYNKLDSAETAQNASQSFLSGSEGMKQSNVFGGAKKSADDFLSGVETGGKTNIMGDAAKPMRTISTDPFERD